MPNETVQINTNLGHFYRVESHFSILLHDEAIRGDFFDGVSAVDKNEEILVSWNAILHCILRLGFKHGSLTFIFTVNTVY